MGIKFRRLYPPINKAWGFYSGSLFMWVDVWICS